MIALIVVCCYPVVALPLAVLLGRFCAHGVAHLPEAPLSTEGRTP